VVVVYAVLFSIINHRGFWTADNGLKYLAIRTQIPHPFQPLDILLSQPVHDESAPTPEIDPRKEAIPLIPPFVHLEQDRVIPVFPPVFIVGSALACRYLGGWILVWIPWLAAAGMLVVFWRWLRSSGSDDSGSSDKSAVAVVLLGLASPLAFYGFTLWEHTVSLLFLVAGFALSYQVRVHHLKGVHSAQADKLNAPTSNAFTSNAPTVDQSAMGRSSTGIKPYATMLIGGFLLGAAGMFRMESWVIALCWMAVWFELRDKWRWAIIFLGLVVAFAIWIATSRLWTGSWIPFQLTENLAVYGRHLGGAPALDNILSVGWWVARWNSLANLLFSAHPKAWLTLLLNGGFIVGAIFALVSKRQRHVNLGYGLVVAAYLAFLILEITSKHPIASTAFTGGLLWCCPWVVFAWRKGMNQGDGRLWKVAASSIILIAFITPISRGVHFGPRLLLGVIPILALLVSRNAYSRGVHLNAPTANAPARLHHSFRLAMPASWMRASLWFWILVGLSVIHQGWGIEVLQRQTSWNADLNARMSKVKESIVITDLWWLPCDLARSWDKHRFFLVSSTHVLRDLMYRMKASGVHEFAFLSEAPATLGKDARIAAGLAIRIEERQEWDSGMRASLEREPIVLERISLKAQNEPTP
jgi:hypothetical protein